MRHRLDAATAEEHVFGYVLLNDWSGKCPPYFHLIAILDCFDVDNELNEKARDIQAYEMMPLGPLNGKNLGTSISPWVVTPDALEPFRTSAPAGAARGVTGYLKAPSSPTYAVEMQVEIGVNGSFTTTCSSNLQTLYWTVPQMIAHLVSAGSGLRTGDIVATGTVSGNEPGQYGCLLEASEGGKSPLKLNDGSERGYLRDGDVVRMTAMAGSASSGVGFGECEGQLLASSPHK